MDKREQLIHTLKEFFDVDSVQIFTSPNGERIEKLNFWLEDSQLQILLDETNGRRHLTVILREDNHEAWFTKL